MLRVDFVSLFPEMIQAALGSSMMKRASDGQAVQFGFRNPRDFCYDRHQKVDDTPYGGAAGMLIKAEPVALALESIGVSEALEDSEVEVILTDPTGVRFNQPMAHRFASKRHLVFLCGHYEGIDHRISKRFKIQPVSVGDFILTNGEIPAMMMADAVVRLLPGVLGSPKSLEADSHSSGLLSAPNYTRPEVWRSEAIPEILKSGDHSAIAKWNRRESLLTTRALRPDLLAKAKVDKSDINVLSS